MRETDNRINRTKHRQQEPSGGKNQQADGALTERNAVLVGNEASQAHNVKELRRKGLTRYDAELISQQGRRYVDVTQPSTKYGENVLQVNTAKSNNTANRRLRNAKQEMSDKNPSGKANESKGNHNLRASR